MRERHPYDPACPDCIPGIVNLQTGTLYERGSPVMVAVMKVWNAAPFAERQAFMDFTNGSDADPIQAEFLEPLMRRIQAAVKRAIGN